MARNNNNNKDTTVPQNPTNTSYNKVVKKWRERGFNKRMAHQLASGHDRVVKTLPELIREVG